VVTVFIGTSNFLPTIAPGLQGVGGASSSLTRRLGRAGRPESVQDARNMAAPLPRRLDRPGARDKYRASARVSWHPRCGTFAPKETPNMPHPPIDSVYVGPPISTEDTATCGRCGPVAVYVHTVNTTKVDHTTAAFVLLCQRCNRGRSL
jgi:hypothetical protein